MAKIVAKKKAAPKKAAAKPVKVMKARPAPARGHKTETMLALMRGRDGATVPEIAKMNGWLPHTTRAAISVTSRKLGLTVAKAVEEGRGLVYRVAA